MNARTAILALAGGALVLLLIKSFRSQPEKGASSAAPQGQPAQTPSAPEASPVVSVVEETLHQHEGEQSPFVAAFEEALHHDAPHGTQPA